MSFRSEISLSRPPRWTVRTEMEKGLSGPGPKALLVEAYFKAFIV